MRSVVSVVGKSQLTSVSSFLGSEMMGIAGPGGDDEEEEGKLAGPMLLQLLLELL